MRFKFYDKENDVEVWIYVIEEIEFRRSTRMDLTWSYTGSVKRNVPHFGIKNLEKMRQEWIEKNVKFERL